MLGIWRIPKIKIGSETIYNVEFSSVSSENAPFLLGMSTLERLGNYSIVPNENKIIIYSNKHILSFPQIQNSTPS